jgi:intein/homing endonuclease
MPFEIVDDLAKYSRESQERVVRIDHDGTFVGVELKEEWDYEPEPELEYEDSYYDRPKEFVLSTPSEFTEFAIRMPDKENQTYVPFSFRGREYLRQIYDTPEKRTLLKCGRQVEKCVSVDAPILLANGRWKRAGDIEVGDEVITLVGTRLEVKPVVWVSGRFKKPGVHIKTRQGHEAIVATTHPMRVWEDWKEAGHLSVGDRLASVRQIPFMGVSFELAHRVPLTAYMLGDGHIGEKYLNFTSLPGTKLDEFLALIRDIGDVERIYAKSGTAALNIRILGTNSTLKKWLGEDGLIGTRSETKFIPSWVFDLNDRQTALFLNRLWSTDGHVKKNSSSKYSIEYCSISKQLIRGVQSLLWKFGIPNKVRLNHPKKGKTAYILRIETQEGIRRFISKIGALGKSENVDLPSSGSNNNRDVYPIQINALISKIIDSRGDETRFGRFAEASLRSSGLRETLKYPPTKEKLELYVSFFRSDTRYDPRLVTDLARHLESDIYWDEIVSLNPLDEDIECVDFEVEESHNFIVGGLVAHNSTMLGNKLLSYSAMITALNALYVSPTNQQSKVFSQDRLKEPIETSEFLKNWTTTKLSDNVFLKKFINRSQITLRYAYLNADRCLAGSTRVQLADGSWKTLKEMCEQGGSYQIISSDPHGRPLVAIANYVRNVGIKEVVDVHTDYPIPLRCTPDHKIFTNRGWVKAQHLTESDFIAAPHAGSLFTPVSIGEDLAWLIGAIISEGECSEPKSVRFCSTDEEFFLEFRERAERVGIKLGKTQIDTRYQIPCYVVCLYSNERLPYLNGSKKTLWDLGEFGEKSWDKHIPVSIFCASVSEKAAFLKSLFSGDGWCSMDGSVAEAGYCTTSAKLAEDICHILWSVGLRPSIRWRGPSTENAKGSYTIDLTPTDTGRLVSFMGEYRLGLTYRNESGKDYKDRIPITYQWLREYVRQTHNLSAHSAWERFKIQLRPDCRKESIGRRVLLSIAEKLNDEYLRTLAHPATSWVQVRSVIPAPLHEEVFDLTVEGPENFLANGLIVSNCRGIPADVICLDELQDLLTDNIPVIEECASHSHMKIFMYAGTPKSLDNTIEYYWSQYSTQNEWAVPCHRHTYLIGGTTIKAHWNILSEDHIGEHYLICDKCQKQIIPNDDMAQWVAQNPGIMKEIPKPYEGYRIPQLMVPWLPWEDILQKYKTYPRDRFYNEVLGLSYDSGTRPLTQQDVIENCASYIKLDDASIEKVRANLASSFPIYAGVDWGTGEGSYTLLSLGTYVNNLFQTFYYKRFEGREADPQTQLEEIISIIEKWQVRKVGCDYGGGFWPNDALTRKFGMGRIVKYQYSTPNQKVRWEDGLKRFLVNRTEVMSDIFNAIKRRDVFRFPNWQQFKHPFGSDFLNIFSEYNEQRRMNEYKKSPGSTDDSFHSTVLCFLVSMLDHPRPDVIAPSIHPRDSIT